MYKNNAIVKLLNFSKKYLIDKSSYISSGIFALVTALIVGTSSYAIAAESDNKNATDDTQATIEEVIVSVRKRSEPVQETPIAITALSAEQLEQRNLTNLMEVGTYIPNVTMNTSPSASGGGNNSQIYIRGIGQTDFLFTTDPGVGVYVDGVYFPRT